MTVKVRAEGPGGVRLNLEYHEQMLSQGTEGAVYATTDGAYVVKLYHPHVIKPLAPLREIMAARPDRGSDFEAVLAWPEAVIAHDVQVASGVVMRRATRDGWLRPLMVYRKASEWLNLPEDERGDFRGRVQAAIHIARATRFLARSGYAHADLSGRNFLVNPVDGRAVLIDLDGLVVPGYMRGGVLGTAGYMAPELVMERKSPDVYSDRHALAVVLYEFLLMNHPLLGDTRRMLASDRERDEYLQSGTYALYKEDPTDDSNRPARPYLSAAVLGAEMNDLFRQAFVEGLHDPAQRPEPDDFEMALVRLLDRLVPCDNTGCLWRYFPDAPVCPMCRTPVQYRGGYARVRRGRGFHVGEGGRVVKVSPAVPLTAGDVFGTRQAAPLLVASGYAGGWHVILEAGVEGVAADGQRFRRVYPGERFALGPGGRLFISQGDRDALIEFSDDGEF